MAFIVVVGGSLFLNTSEKPVEKVIIPHSNLGTGTHLYARSDGSYLGHVAEYSNKHVFPDGTTKPGVLMQYTEGEPIWIPLDALLKAYEPGPEPHDIMVRSARREYGSE